MMKTISFIFALRLLVIGFVVGAVAWWVPIIIANVDIYYSVGIFRLIPSEIFLLVLFPLLLGGFAVWLEWLVVTVGLSRHREKPSTRALMNMIVMAVFGVFLHQLLYLLLVAQTFSVNLQLGA